jgi:N-acetylmuramoyl-L-alanine amidase
MTRGGPTRWSRAGLLTLAGAAVAALVAAGAVTAGGGHATAMAVPRTVPRVVKPPIVWRPIVFGEKRKAETARYCKRHYGSNSYLLTPKVIVLHFTGGSTWQAAWNYFSHDVPDPEFHELPGPVSHFIIGKDGTIYQTISLSYRGRHCYGLNYVAIGIEFVQELPAGKSSHWADVQILHRTKQITAGLKLVKWLQARYRIKLSNVIGHSMAHGSPYYRDLLHPRYPDHSDWQKVDVLAFRARLASVN